MRRLAFLVLVLVPMCAQLAAGIVGTMGGAEVIAPPPSVALHQLESSELIYVFPEQEDVFLTDAISLNVTLPGTVERPSDLTPGTIPAGTVVDSFFVHFDPVGSPGSTPSLGSIMFEGEILGLAILQSELDATDAILGLATTTYPTGVPGRLLDLLPEDSLNLSLDRKSVTISLKAGGRFDSLRVVTADAVPGHQWKLSHGGSYNLDSNWTDGTVPRFAGDVANFLGSIEDDPSTVIVDSSVTVGTINFDNADCSYVIAEGVLPADVTLETSTGNAQINVDSGVHTISAPLSLATDTDVMVGPGHILFLSGDVSDVGSRGLTKMGLGMLSLSGNNTYLGDTSIVEGTLSVGSNDSLGDPSSVLRFDGGTLRTTGAFSGSRNVIIGAGGATINTMDATSLTLNSPGQAVAYGDLTKNGTGTCLLGQGLLLMGNVNVNAGTLQVAKDVLLLGGGDVNLAEGTTLRASGTVGHHLINSGAPGTSTVEATGTLEIGDSDDENGYAYNGALEVGPYMVGLKDADEAPLYGAHIQGGTISTFNGLRLLPINMADGLNSRLYGFGTVNGNVVMGNEGNPTAAVVEADPGQTIELTGVVQTGNSTFVNNVVITGTERLGFSPAVGMKLGGAPIGPDAVVEVYGTAGADFESEIPDALAPPVADPVSGYGQFYVAGGESLVSGKITLTTGGSDYVGRGGDTFDLIVTGQAWLMDFTQFPPQNVLLPEGSVNIDPGFIVDTSGIPLASPGLFWQEFRSDQGLTLKIVPEPGTLVLLLTGGLGLLLVWRKRR